MLGRTLKSSKANQIKEKDSYGIISPNNRQAAANAIRDLVSSIAMPVDDKVAIEHQINNLSRESEYMLDRIDSITKANNQLKVLLAYKEFLERNLEAVNSRLRALGHRTKK